MEAVTMPIRAERKSLYLGGGTHSKEWKAFRASLLERAGNRCEGTPMHPDCRAENGKPHPVTGSKVVLTIATPIRSVAVHFASAVIFAGMPSTMPPMRRSPVGGSLLRSTWRIFSNDL
jgi:hypothetical protein